VSSHLGASDSTKPSCIIHGRELENSS